MRSSGAWATGRALQNTGNIYLVGLSGCGKSTVGPILAQRSGWTFVDTDHLIEEATGMEVAEIFGTLGEAAFRTYETNMIEQIATLLRDVVVSLGGGAILSGRNRTLLHETGTVVYIKASPDVLAERLARTSERRPLLKSGGGNLAQTLERMLDQRARLYEEAHLTVESDGLSPEQIADQVQAGL
jgi:shikimate kinase